MAYGTAMVLALAARENNLFLKLQSHLGLSSSGRNCICVKVSHLFLHGQLLECVLQLPAAGLLQSVIQDDDPGHPGKSPGHLTQR